MRTAPCAHAVTASASLFPRSFVLQVFSAVGVKPAQTTFGGTLVRDWIKVEIEATAIIGS